MTDTGDVSSAQGDQAAHEPRVFEVKARPARRLATYLFGVLLPAGFGAVITLIVIALVIVPGFSGASAFVIETNSMAPDYPPGTIVVVFPVAPKSLRIGDVITFRSDLNAEHPVTHRIAEVSQSTDGVFTYRTRGDNNSLNDPMRVEVSQIRGVVAYAIPYLGLVSLLISADLKALFVTLVGIALVVFGLYSITRHVARRHARRTASSIRREV